MSRLYQFGERILPSVTTILRLTEDEDAKENLRKWQHKMDKIYGVGGADTQAQKARDRGTMLHEAIDGFWKWKGTYEEYSPEPEDVGQWNELGVDLFWENISQWVKLHKPYVKEWELNVISNKDYPYAGTLDLILKDEQGVITLVDFKTSKRQKMRKWLTEYWLQAAAYAIAYEETQGEEVKELELLIISPGECQTFIEELWQPYAEAWESRLECFYKYFWEEVKSNQSNCDIKHGAA